MRSRDKSEPRTAEMLKLRDAALDEIENVGTVFKAGIGYDSNKLIDSVRGQVGIG